MELIAGCGYLGQRLTHALAEPGQLTGLIRSQASAQALKSLAIPALQLDLDRPPSGKCISGMEKIYYLIPPPKTGQHDPRMQHFLAALRPPLPEKILYISTTGVYGDCQGQWIDESKPTQATADRAKRRLDAEQQLLAYGQNHHCDIVILRVAGIYGPDKLPLARLKSRKPMIAASEAPWTNRIHIDDLVRVCMAAMQRATHGSIFNVTDGQPGKMTDYFNRVADRAGLPRPPLISIEQASSQLSSGMRSYLQESRRIDNRKMLAQLGIRLQYPDLGTGLENCGL